MRACGPRLVKLGGELAPELARKLHLEFFPHVAKHARRTVNPPPETWAAFGPSPRGYKRYGYLALCISGAGLHARVVVKSEADRRLEMARGLASNAAQLAKSLRGTGIARYDKWDFNAAAHRTRQRTTSFSRRSLRGSARKPARWTSGSDGACATRCGWIARS